jgi:hypothetical protein
MSEMETDAVLNNPLVAIALTSLLTFAGTAYFVRRKTTQKTLDRITELENKLAVLNQSMVPFNSAFQAILIKELTHIHTPEMDALLVKLGPPNILTQAEEIRLANLLIERADADDPTIPEYERDAARILPAVIRRAHHDIVTAEAIDELRSKVDMAAVVIRSTDDPEK